MDSAFSGIFLMAASEVSQPPKVAFFPQFIYLLLVSQQSLVIGVKTREYSFFYFFFFKTEMGGGFNF